MKEFQITFEKYVDLIKSIRSVEEWSFKHITHLEEEIKERDEHIKDLQKTIRFQRYLIHTKIIQKESGDNENPKRTR